MGYYSTCYATKEGHGTNSRFKHLPSARTEKFLFQKREFERFCSRIFLQRVMVEREKGFSPLEQRQNHSSGFPKACKNERGRNGFGRAESARNPIVCWIPSKENWKSPVIARNISIENPFRQVPRTVQCN